MVGAVVAILAVLPLWKLFQVQIGDGHDLVAQGRSQRVRTEHLDASRGAIVDRDGAELAISLPRKRLVANKVILASEGVEDRADLEQLARRLSELTGWEQDELADRLVSADDDDAYVPLAETLVPGVAAAAVDAVEEDGVHGALILEDTEERVHPAGESALRVIGTLGPDGPAELAGVERSFDEELTGTPGERIVELGTKGETIAGAEKVSVVPVPGNDVMLTLDRTLQHDVEDIVTAGASRAGAARGVAIVGRPATGEILAAGSVERDSETGEIGLSNAPLAFSNAYQAGSVFKLVTVAAAIEAGQVDAGTTFSVGSQIEIADQEFSDAEPHAVEQLSVTDIVAKSSNVGTIQIGMDVGAERLHGMLADFGFGAVTGIHHPAESKGQLPPAADWTRPDLAASSIGTHQSATAVQLWAAYNVIANNGWYVQPRLVDSVIGPDGTRTAVERDEPRRVIAESTADQLGDMLREVVETGTGKRWDLPGYPVAAKTGTSRMASPKRVSSKDGYMWEDGRYHYVTAFTGYLPADRPEVSITVILEDTTNGLTGSVAAGPVFSDLARLSIRELGIAPANSGADAATGAETLGWTAVRSAPATPVGSAP